ncbi:Virulence factor MVIN family protein [Candidatus Sulfopaludibacter sp. SbA6]|nr:Virulence factor MVIN family protein [Candidatus Sulfopaludibacter sp. SbA6]
MDSPLVRGGLTLVAGVLAGNLLGFGRVAVTAYLLGTHSRADSLAVAMGPMDTLNSVLINSVVFAFVPMLTACTGRERTALFLKLSRCFSWVSLAIAAALALSAPWLMRALAPGLDPHYFGTAVNVLRIMAVSTLAAGTGAVQCALLYTHRRFAPTAFYQATINIITIVAALSLWKFFGVYAFALGYATGVWAQLGIVWFAARRGLEDAGAAECEIHWRDILAKPAFFLVYAAGLSLNITFTRAYATHAGPGMAAALDYCMRGVGVPMALLVTPISNSLLPEIARLRSLFRLREAFRLIDRTMALTALAAVAGCTFAIVFRRPAIALFFQHGNFTADSTTLVSAVFLGLGPSLVGWSLMEIGSRSLFALNRPWLPVIAAVIPVLLNVTLTLRVHSFKPGLLGVGSSLGLLAGFAVLFLMMRANRGKWLAEG